MLLQERKMLTRRIETILTQNKIQLDRQLFDLTSKYNNEFKDKLQSHLNNFNHEAKTLRLQLLKYQREFTAKDLAFLKLRNAASQGEFLMINLKKYLGEGNMRMVYKLLGMQVPKFIRTKMTERGLDFIDYWPVQANSAIPHETVKSTLGLTEVPNPG